MADFSDEESDPNERELNVTNVTNRYVLFIVWKFALFVFRICRFNRFFSESW